ncbi:asparaginase [Pigmentiphaga kullae]|uniref:L-asparaginase n=1 Tax=Pigmentiphaga kullae TaxID=151784 RepID=A0A4Q7N7V6_9BURK|nr:asparaginase [Pigmentiphaga kullae]RZS78146.1 L-asparaginase [Pigmentiphaga kullae]
MTRRIPAVRILATGGTIAGAAPSPRDTSGYQAGALPVDALLAALPPMDDVRVDARQLFSLDSKDALPGFWQALAREAALALTDPAVDGVVLTHGTDTMEETAWFLHLTLAPAKPLVITGAMRPATATSADGPMNLLQAVQVAACPHAARQGVIAVLNGQIHHARHLRKAHTHRVDAFDSGEAGPVGFVQDGYAGWLSPPRRTTPRFAPETPLAPVDILFDYPGISAAMVDAALRGGARGLVWAGYGNGSVSGRIEPLLREAHGRGLAIVRASRTGAGRVGVPDPGGFPQAAGLDPYKARIALMLALGAGTPPAALQALFDTLSYE